MVLNEDGERLLIQIAPVLDQLSDAVEAMTAGKELVRLRLGVLPLFAAQRLFPKLGELRGSHPELHLDIDTAGMACRGWARGWTRWWRWARDRSGALFQAARPQFGLCHRPARLAGGAASLTHPRQLESMTALLHREMPDTMGAWSVAAGLGVIKPQAIDLFVSGGLMLEAAAAGTGRRVHALPATITMPMIPGWCGCSR